MSAKAGKEVVKAREFDITQYVKKLGASIGVIAAATAGALKLFGNSHITSGILAAALGVLAVALLGICFISAVDIAARAYVTSNPPPADPTPKPDDGGTTAPAPLPLGGASQKVLAWLEGDPQPRLVLAVAGDGKESKYLLSGSETGGYDLDGTPVVALKGSPAWHDAGEIRAVKGAGLP